MPKLRRIYLAQILMLSLAFVALGTMHAEGQPIQAKPAVVSGNVWLLRNSLSSGFAEAMFTYGTGTRFGFPLMGDWDGDGVKTPGVVYDNQWFLRNSNTSGIADVRFTYGVKGDYPIVGDWDGDGIDTPGVVREHIEFLDAGA